MIKIIAPKAALQLGLFALLSAGFLAGLHVLTRSAIKHNEAQHTAQLLAHVIPENTVTSAASERLIDGNAQALWQVLADQRVVGVVLPVTATGGYSGDIELLVGIDTQQRISGVRVTRHRETPGLGDKIESRRSDWIKSFNGLSLDKLSTEQWAVKKDGGVFDQFTGATITPRAIVRRVRDTLVFSQKHHAQLFEPTPTPATTSQQP